MQRYVNYFDNSLIPEVGLVTPQVGTVLYSIASQYPDVLAPIDVPGTNGTAYIGLQLTEPGIIAYHLGARIPPVPVPEPERVRVRKPVQREIRVPDPEPVPWYVPVGAASHTPLGILKVA